MFYGISSDVQLSMTIHDHPLPRARNLLGMDTFFHAKVGASVPRVGVWMPSEQSRTPCGFIRFGHFRLQGHAQSVRWQGPFLGETFEVPELKPKRTKVSFIFESMQNRLTRMAHSLKSQFEKGASKSSLGLMLTSDLYMARE